MNETDTTTLFIELDKSLKDAMVRDVEAKGMTIRTWLTRAIQEKLDRDGGKS